MDVTTTPGITADERKRKDNAEAQRAAEKESSESLYKIKYLT